VPADLPLLRGDPGRLRQILLNLADNAIKFTPQGEVVVRARREDETTDALALRFSVRDTGIGIPSALQGAIFEPFVQVHGGTRRAHEGAGLGLSVARTLAESMNCRLAMESEPGVGSQFVLIFPA